MDLFDEIKDRLPFEIEARQRGIEFNREKKALCPFHDDRNPSFHNYGTHGYCHSCQKFADVIELEYVLGNHSSRYEAALTLNEKHNLGLKPNGFDKEKADERQRAQELLRQYCAQANSILLDSQFALAWLLKMKGITKDDVKKYHIGYIERNGIKDRTDLKKNITLAEKLGLVKNNKEGNRYIEHFYSRIVFPIYERGQIKGIHARTYPDDQNTPKWLGLPHDTEVHNIVPFKPILWPENLNREYCLIVESAIDAITLDKTGFFVCALLGTSINKGNQHLFEKAKGKLLFALDGDEAGKEAAYKLAKEYKGYVIDLGEKDADELLVELGPEQFKTTVEKGIWEARYYLDEIIEREKWEGAIEEIGTLPTEGEQELYLKKLSKKSGIGFQTLKRDMKKSREQKESTPNPEVIICDPRPILHPAMSIFNDNLIYGSFNQTRAYYICDRKILDKAELTRNFVIQDDPQQLRFSAKAINEYREGRESNRQLMFDGICSLLERYLIFPAPWQIPMISFWIIGTYMHRAFPLFPYLWINSPTKRCGKTILLELIDALSFNSTGIQTAPTQAVLYRIPAVTGGTLCWDEAENLHKGKEGGERIEVINMAYRNGGIVQRCEGDDNKVKNFEVFRPIAIAGIETVHDTVQDRSIKIELARKSEGQKVNRLQIDRIKKELQDLRDELHICALERTPAIKDVFDNFPTEMIPNCGNDRLRNALEVIFSVAEGMGVSFPPALLDATKDLCSTREAEEGELGFIRAINILKDELASRDREDLIITSQEALNLFQQGGIEDLKEKKDAQALLRKMKIFSDSHYMAGIKVRGYKIEMKKIEDLGIRYSGTAQL